METKVCTSCGQEKPIEEFPWKSIIRRKRHARCKTCTAQDSGSWYETNKEHHKENVKVNRHKAKQAAREFVYQYLLTHPCEGTGPEGCPYHETDPTVLEFHHVGKKDRDVAQMVAHGFSVATIAHEISQCKVLCANYHRRLTAEKRKWFRWRK